MSRRPIEELSGDRESGHDGDWAIDTPRWKRAVDSGEKVRWGTLGCALEVPSEPYDDEARAAAEAAQVAERTVMEELVKRIPPHVWAAAPTDGRLLAPWIVRQARQVRGTPKRDPTNAERQARYRARMRAQRKALRVCL